MLTCQEKECLGWTLLSSDQFCAWCGGRLVELTISFESKVGDGPWMPLKPAVLNRARPPHLRVRITHSGDAGSVELTPDCIRSRAEWLGLNLGAMVATRLAPGESLWVDVNRCKVPGKDDSVQEATLAVVCQTLTASATLEFVPSPEFHIDLAVGEVLLTGEGCPTVDGVLRLVRGRVWLEEVPELVGGWADLELFPEQSNQALDRQSLPLELDARSRARLPFRLTLREEVMYEIKQSAADRPEALVRTATLRLKCRDRGLPPGDRRSEDTVTLEPSLELSFILGPELYLEPFREDVRWDWDLVRGLNDRHSRALIVRNGAPGARGRMDLVIRHLDIEYQQGPTGWLSLDEAPPLPWTIPGGRQLTLSLRADGERLGADGATARLVFVSNDHVPRSYYIRARRVEPGEFPGWLVVDLGTSTTCAALLDENRSIAMLSLDEPVTLGRSRPRESQVERSGGLPSVVCYLQLKTAHLLEVGSWALLREAEPAALRAIVSGAKRRVGDARFQFEVVPLDEPGETFAISPTTVLEDIYHHVVGRAMEALEEQGRTDLLLTRAVITHPSRFSVHQIDELRRAVRGALKRRLQEVDCPLPLEEPFTLHEPVGAALHFLNDWTSHAPIHRARRADEVTYTLLVYDYGGGTLDITLLSVHSRRALRPGCRPEPEPVACEPAAPAPRPVRALAEVLQELVLQQCRLALEAKLGNGVRLGDPEVNGFVVREFVRSILACQDDPRQLLEQWDDLAGNPHVNEKLLIAVDHGDEHLLTRAQALPTRERLAEALGEGRPEPTTPEASGDHPYSYMVVPQVLGATGHRWMGGEDLTARLTELLAARLTEAVSAAEKQACELPLEAADRPLHQALAARRNQASLREWAEGMKIRLSEGDDPETLQGPSRGLTFFVGERERPYTGTALRRLLKPPSLSELEALVESDLEETVDLIATLLNRHGLDRPDVLLRVGKASKLPAVDRILKAHFPEPIYVAPKEAKECVVKGACTPALPGRVSSGVQLARGLDRPSVRVRLARQSLNATTSRLGIKIIDSGKAWFHELIGAGVAVPADGLETRLTGVVLQTGLNQLPILENSGHRDEIPNPDIETIRVFEIPVPPDADPFALEDVELLFQLHADLSFGLRVQIEGLEPIIMDTVASTEYGGTY